ncbi:ABC transporter permease [candidate division KSB1 bacterium]
MKNKNPKIPFFAVLLLRLLLSEEEYREFTDDLDEVYRIKVENQSKAKATLWYWMRVIESIPSIFCDKIIWSITMFKNYFKITVRNLRRYKAYSFINIAGFAIGIACCLLILLFVQDELSYDRYHQNADRIYRIGVKGRLNNNEFNLVSSAPPMAKTLLNEFPEVQKAVRIYKRSDEEYSVRYQDNIFNETDFLYADVSVFEVFTFPLIEGDPKTALENPNSVIITKATAEKYFGGENPMGKTLTLNNNYDYTVTGIAENVPHNSHFHFDFLASLVTLGISRTPIWLNNNVITYIVLQKDYPISQLEAKFPDIIQKYIGPQVKMALGITLDEFKSSGGKYDFFTQPLTDIHLHSNFMAEFESNSDIKYVYIFLVIALFILIIACINFMNLSTARSAARAKEIGIRKVMGSNRTQIIRQFLTESVVLTFISVLIALILVKLTLPFFNNITGKQMAAGYLSSIYLIPLIVGIVFVVGILAGSYPAFFLSSFHPIFILQKRLKTEKKSQSIIRNGLVVFQFAVFIALGVSTFVVRDQLDFIRNRKLGFDKEHIVIINRAQSLGTQFEEFKQEISKHSGVTCSSASSILPGKQFSVTGFQIEGKPKEEVYQAAVISADYDFAKTYGLEITEGRYFSKEHTSDTLSVVISESAVKSFDFENPIGKFILAPSNNRTARIPIIGVIKDFHFESLHQKIRPIVIVPSLLQYMYVSVRIRPENISNTLSFLKNKWEYFAPGQPFDTFFLDDQFDSLYRADRRMGQIISVFSVLALFIGCLGLYGLASSSTERRAKEIGIRKVLGASIPNIVFLFTKEFSKWVLIANIIAWPAAWYAMNQWIQNFAYRTGIGWNLFLISGIIAFIIAILTISYQVIISATANPVKCLRNE